MAEKRMLIIDDELMKKIDENRGEMGRAEFVAFLINNQLEEKTVGEGIDHRYVEREEFMEFSQA